MSDDMVGGGVAQSACRKCGGTDLRVRYWAHCPHRDCDHKYCGEKLGVTCAICGFYYERKPLDASTS